jgi:hypothetical protein
MRDTNNCKAYAVCSAALGLLLLTPLAHSVESPKLSATELKAVYKAAGLKVRGGKLVDDCDQPAQPETEVIDLNGDGRPEIFVMVNSSCYGMAGGQLTLLIKNKQGRWKSNLGFPAGGYKLMSTKSKGYPDIEIGLPGLCAPVWRWNGIQYAIHKRCDR